MFYAALSNNSSPDMDNMKSIFHDNFFARILDARDSKIHMDNIKSIFHDFLFFILVNGASRKEFAKLASIASHILALH